jgi:type I restriction enzyme S subunit
MMDGDLPPGWVSTTLGAVLKLKYGKALPNAERKGGSVPVFGSGGLAGWHSSAITLGPTIVVGRKGTFGEVWLSDTACWPIDTTFYVDEFFGQSIDFWAFYLKFLPLKSFDRSSAVPGLRRADAESVRILLPPADEQFRIAEKIKLCSNQIENVEQIAEQLQLLCDQHRKLVLKKAVEGKLLESLPSQGESRTKPHSTKGSENSEHPWQSCRIGTLGEVRLGRQRAPKYHQGDRMRPYLRVANILEDKIDTSDIMEMHFSDEEFLTYKLQVGDILLNEGQSLELVGRSAIYNGEIEEVCFTNTLIRFRCHERIIPDYAQIVFKHYLHSGKFQKIAKITTNLAHLGAGRFADMEIPVPSVPEQREIATRAKDHLKLIDGVEAELERLLRLAREARSAVLRRAFQGGFALHDPRDVSADELLKRVAEQFAKSKITKPAGSPASGRGSKMDGPQPVHATLLTALEPLTAQELFAAAGYPADAETELVERFFLDLRQALEAGTVLESKSSTENTYTASIESAR